MEDEAMMARAGQRMVLLAWLILGRVLITEQTQEEADYLFARAVGEHDPEPDTETDPCDS